ncbi:DUF917 domain-containing protein [Acidilutibacter cellobiosedens]|jgi:hypothetical protein|uniref:DUF917 domain-containing protein n=1 Tax=Acidilutibacter cellobiosedens TaxID=2507161 RepID=A0A410QCN8_9FIRM|nr:DUF917 domain-containing protein [Acidilutibacter cellobiosedens]QAT61751.1 DUF917 domain-containing protein [Acidilutibacter cellobiosedens]
MIKLTRQDLIDILYGATILGTGGGGSLSDGIKKIDEALDLNKEFILVDFDELEDDDLIATPYSCGAISPLTEEEIKKYEGLPVTEEASHVIALREMEKYLGKEVKAVISTELGGGNTATAFYSGAMAGKYIVDADPAGRSVPELQHSTYYLNNVSIHPMSLVNKFGESVIITNVVNDFRAESLVRALAVVSQNSIAVVDHVEPTKTLKKAVIRGAITNALKIGRAYRTAKENNEDISEKIADSGKGKVIFKGCIFSNDWDTLEGFTVGTLTIKGSGEYNNDEFKVWYKNENIITWRNGKYDAVVPDLICIFNEDEKEPLLNPYGKEGMKVSVIVLPAPKEWTTEKGLKTFGPRHFGHDIDWKPYI